MKFYPKKMRDASVYDWHRKFAWLPTKIESVTVWLETYEQRRRLSGVLGRYFFERRLLWTDGIPDKNFIPPK